MVQLTLPKNSKIGKGRHYPAPVGAKTVKTFRVYRWDPEGEGNPVWDSDGLMRTPAMRLARMIQERRP